MGMNVGQTVSELRRMTVTELRRKYAEVFSEQTRSYHKEFLVRRIAWRIQANEEGGLPERARLRALEIANDADLRTRAPGPGTPPTPARLAATVGAGMKRRMEVPTDDRLPMPGALLTRQYKGRSIRVRVLPSGFDYDGTVYRSLSAIAEIVTGSHWNGYLFFGLKPPTPQKKPTKAVAR